MSRRGIDTFVIAGVDSTHQSQLQKFEGLRQCSGRDWKLENLFSALQFRPATSVAEQPNTSRGLLWDSEKDRELSKTGHAPGRLHGRSSFIEHPGTTFFPPHGKNKDAAPRPLLLMSFK